MAQDAQRQAFVRKLGEFRSTLSPEEQRMLDSVMYVAEQGTTTSDVQLYGYFFSGDTTNPGFYNGSMDAIPDGMTSAWWTMYSTSNHPFR
jgi:hypothetical protein